MTAIPAFHSLPILHWDPFKSGCGVSTFNVDFSVNFSVHLSDQE